MRTAVAAGLAGGAVLVAAVIGTLAAAQKPSVAAWYLRLRKPPYTPPALVIGPTWGVLELLLACSGYRLLREPASSARSTALGAWAATLLGLAAFPWVFFREKRLGTGTLVAGAMLASASVATAAAGRADRGAAALTTPVVAWLAFATLLSRRLRQDNRSRSAD